MIAWRCIAVSGFDAPVNFADQDWFRGRNRQIRDRNQCRDRRLSDKSEDEIMGKAYYDVIGDTNQWGVRHDGDATGDYATKEAAFEAACAAASNAIKFGHEVRISVPGSDGGEAALGGKSN
jgi:hypothetical protein